MLHLNCIAHLHLKKMLVHRTRPFGGESRRRPYNGFMYKLPRGKTNAEPRLSRLADVAHKSRHHRSPSIIVLKEKAGFSDWGPSLFHAFG